jgi:hypothetical protein
MTLALTCPCGARLEIDEKFAGQAINCPDCNRPLSTAPPAPKPAQTSGCALASLVLALVGAFTLVGTVAAIVCGVVGLGQIRRAPAQIGGRRFAQAGIVLGIGFTLLTLLALSTTELVRLDGLLRTVEWAGKYEETSDEVEIRKSGGFDGPSGTIRRPSPAWVRLISKDPNKQNTDDLILVNLWEDAYIVCLNKWLDPGQTLEACRLEGQQRFLQSDLVTKILGRTSADSPPLTGQDRDRKQLPGTETQEFLFEIRLGGVDRTFLIRVLRDGTRLNIIAGGTRKNRFARLQPDLVKALDSYKMEK